jgi:hypothetical protein
MKEGREGGRERRKGGKKEREALPSSNPNDSPKAQPPNTINV